jgi:DNA invertase Pin-like site-specific DNA recombinase
MDLSTPAGRLMLNVIASVAEYETEVRKERQLAGMARAKAATRTDGQHRDGQPDDHDLAHDLETDPKNLGPNLGPLADTNRDFAGLSRDRTGGE